MASGAWLWRCRQACGVLITSTWSRACGLLSLPARGTELPSAPAYTAPLPPPTGHHFTEAASISLTAPLKHSK